jgi:hypothetical protein
MSIKYKALEKYYTDPLLPLLYEASDSFGSIKRAGIKINNNDFSLADYEGLMSFVEQVQEDAGKLTKLVISEVEKHKLLNQYLVRAGSVKTNYYWTVTFNILNKRKKTKKYASITFNLDFDEKAKPAFTCTLSCPKELRDDENIKLLTQKGYEQSVQEKYDSIHGLSESEGSRTEYLVEHFPMLRGNSLISESSFKEKLTEVIFTELSNGKSRGVIAKLAKGSSHFK